MRVARAVQQGLDSPNQIIVVGIKGADVAKATSAQSGRVFAYQENPVLGLPAGTGDAVTGAASLFALALGMGVPLIIFGTGGGHFLPRAGQWMEDIKRFFGYLISGKPRPGFDALLNEEALETLAPVPAE